MHKGIVYMPGATVHISSIIVSFNGEDTSLVCVTSNVNTRCCTGADGGDVGEWFFPDGTMVPRNDDGGGFVRFGSSQKIHLSHTTVSRRPTGNFTCRVPDGQNSSLIHSASITVILGK